MANLFAQSWQQLPVACVSMAARATPKKHSELKWLEPK
jgi:hypothetical protein